MPSSRGAIPTPSAISARTSKMAHPWSAFSFRMPRGSPSSTSRVTKAIFNASTMPACSRVACATGRDTTACARYGERQVEIEDPYRFPPILSDLDLYLLGEGAHMHLYEKLGAHPMALDGVEGVAFAVFAPAAQRVSVVGDFNLWDGRRHAMRVRGNGFWEIFVPETKAGAKYKI
jgi:FAD/FMN-containing dehydrogenase